MTPATSVRGTVHDLDSGQPVGAATVTAVGPNGEAIASTVSDLDGVYRITGLDADAVMLVVAAPGADPRTTEVELGGGEHVVDLALDTYSTLSGTVTVDGQPVEHLRLALYAQDGQTAATTVTDRAGVYRFGRTRAGQYTLASAGQTLAVAPDVTTVDVTMA